MQEWNIDLADAVQTTGEPSSLIIVHYSFVRTLIVE
jgi:hypothetical protein